MSQLLPGLLRLRLPPDPPLRPCHQARQGLLLQHVRAGLHLGDLPDEAHVQTHSGGTPGEPSLTPEDRVPRHPGANLSDLSPPAVPPRPLGSTQPNSRWGLQEPPSSLTTYPTCQKAWSTEALPDPAPGQPGQLQDSGLFWWHPKTISEHFEPVCRVFFFFFFVPPPSLASLSLVFFFFFKFVLEITKRIFIGQNVGAAKNERFKGLDGRIQREPEGSVGTSLTTTSGLEGRPGVLDFKGDSLPQVGRDRRQLE